MIQSKMKLDTISMGILTSVCLDIPILQSTIISRLK